MDIRIAPLLTLAEATAAQNQSEDWWQTLANYGIAGIMLGWFMWRDKLDRDERTRHHAENISQQRRIEDAFRSTTDSLIVGIGAMKNIDSGYSELLQKVRAAHPKDNEN